MKKLSFIISFFIMIICAKGQNKFEEFTVNDNVGIVEIANLNEFLMPGIIFQNKININPNYFIYRENDSAKVFNKKTGSWHESLFIGKSYPILTMDDKKYLITISNDKNVIYNSDLKVEFTLKKKYEEVQSLPSNFFFGRDRGSIDIYQLHVKNTALKHSIKASDYSKRKENYDPESVTDYIFFFGGEKTYQFDLNFKLVKEINKKFDHSYQLDEYLRSQTKTVMRVGTGRASAYTEKVVNPNAFQLIEKKEKNRFSSAVSLFEVTTDSNFELKSENSEDFIVYKVFTSIENGITYTSMGSANSYRFKIQGVKPKILLPLKYQKEIGISIVGKK